MAHAKHLQGGFQLFIWSKKNSVLQMAHGGTNFGFYSGANIGQVDSDYKPDLTSYDYVCTR